MVTTQPKVKIITKESLVKEKQENRKKRLENMLETAPREHIHYIERSIMALEAGRFPNAQLRESFDPNQHVKVKQGAQTVVEFTGGNAQSYASDFWKGIRYAQTVGRDEEPFLGDYIYSIVENPNAHETETVYKMSSDNIEGVFEEILPGQEVPRLSVSSTDDSIRQRHYALGALFTKWQLAFDRFDVMQLTARALAIRGNALRNNVYLSPILTHTYASRQKTNGTTVTNKFKASADMVEKVHRTLSVAISNSRGDNTYKRRGPYVLLCALDDLDVIERALIQVTQEKFAYFSPTVASSINAVVVYDGWTGTRGKKETTYSGVTAGKAYLVNLSHAEEDFQSIVKQPMMSMAGVGDPSRFIIEDVIYDTIFGLHSDPEKSVEEITLPISTSGDS